MGLTTSLSTGLTGLRANSRMLSVAGNNISNVNTTGYKSSRAVFETQFSRTLANASGPTADLGGTNPAQVGLGTKLSAIQRDFNSGSLKPTGVATDMAMEGDGFFVVDQGDGRSYTRAGNFNIDSESNLVTNSGGYVMGYGVDENFEVTPGQLQRINLPMGDLTIAEPTESIDFGGNLNSSGPVATQGTRVNSGALYSDAAATSNATAGTNLASLYDGAGNQLFNTGDVLSLTGASKGGAEIPDATFEVGPANTTESDANGTTLGSLAGFLENGLGLATGGGLSGGVTVSGGQIQVQGNTGLANAIDLDDGNLVANQGASPDIPLAFTKTREATGESTRTTFAAYDSLGNPLQVDMSVVLEQKSNAGTTWRFSAQSADDSDLNPQLGTGTLKFDPKGQLMSADGTDVVLDREGSGAVTPQTLSLNFSSDNGGLSAFAGEQTELNAREQDGSSKGTLTDFNIGADGTISGEFSNGLSRMLGRIAAATFANNQGLEATGGSMFKQTANSGEAQIVTATTGGTGRIAGRTLEQSNVDLAESFTDLITASTGYSANSRVITTSDRLLKELMTMAR